MRQETKIAMPHEFVTVGNIVTDGILCYNKDFANKVPRLRKNHDSMMKGINADSIIDAFEEFSHMPVLEGVRLTNLYCDVPGIPELAVVASLGEDWDKRWILINSVYIKLIKELFGDSIRLAVCEKSGLIAITWWEHIVGMLAILDLGIFQTVEELIDKVLNFNSH